MLGKHLDRLILGDRFIQRIPQTPQELIELYVRIFIRMDDLADAVDMALGDLRYISRPHVPIHLGAAFADDQGVYGLLELLL